MLISTSEDKSANPGLEDYIELKTTMDSNRRALRRWYMQSYLLGVPVLMVGYRHPENPVTVSRIERKTIEEVRLKARKHFPEFDHVSRSLGRAHAILHELLEYFRSLQESKSKVSVLSEFELWVDEHCNAWVMPLNISYKSAGWPGLGDYTSPTLARAHTVQLGSHMQ